MGSVRAFILFTCLSASRLVSADGNDTQALAEAALLGFAGPPLNQADLVIFFKDVELRPGQRFLEQQTLVRTRKSYAAVSRPAKSLKVTWCTEHQFP